MATSDLPPEILIDILSRLPVKSVGKCRCLSKSWRIILSSPQFIKSHLNRKALNQQNLLLITPSNSIHTIDNVIDGAISRELKLQDDWVEVVGSCERDDWVEVVGSCDGLVLLVNEKYEKFLVNPITLQQAKVPNPHVALKSRHCFSMHGFGYDSSVDEYKIVTLSYYNSDSEYDPDCVDTFVDVYYVKRDFWKRVNSSPYDHAVPELSHGAFPYHTYVVFIVMIVCVLVEISLLQ